MMMTTAMAMTMVDGRDASNGNGDSVCGAAGTRTSQHGLTAECIGNGGDGGDGDDDCDGDVDAGGDEYDGVKWVASVENKSGS